MPDLQIKKHRESFRSEAWIKYVRSLPCLPCKKLGRGFQASSPSHLESRKYFFTDAKCLPACIQLCHPKSTKAAVKVFADAGINTDEALKILWSQFAKDICKVEMTFDGAEHFENFLIAQGLGERCDKSKRQSRIPLGESTKKKPARERNLQPTTKTVNQFPR
jgi:hypothetical protein